MDDSHWNDVLAACDELADLIKRHEAGVNDGALRRTLALCRRLRGPSNYTNDRVNKIEYWVERYFSTRRWTEHKRGADGVRFEIVQVGLGRIRDETNARKIAAGG